MNLTNAHLSHTFQFGKIVIFLNLTFAIAWNKNVSL